MSATETEHEQGTEAPEDEAAIQAANDLPDEERPPDDDKTIEDLAKEDTPTPPMQLALPGTSEKVPGRMGGAKPSESTIRVMGGRLPVVGVFEKGEVVELRVKVKIGEVGEVDAHDAFGNVQKTTRVHKARMFEVVRIDAP